MKLGKSLASLLSDLPIPVVEGPLNLLQQVHDYIKENKRIRLIAGITFYDGKFVPLLKKIIIIAEGAVESVDSVTDCDWSMNK